ncbi:MAG: sigma-54-dependent Fis family transcriptional regulator [Thermodesulfobacteriota bacterium]
MKEQILVVDDEESIRFTFQDFLEDAGYGVDTAKNYDEATQMLEIKDFDLVFVDIVLNGRSGIDLLQRIKPKDSFIQVIIITGAPSIDSASQGLRLGALDYLVKPVREETLLRLTRMALRHKSLLVEKENYQLNLDAIFRSVKDGIISVNKNMIAVQCNEAAERICGMRKGEIIGKSLPSLIGNCSGKCLMALRETLKSGKPVETQNIECHSFHHPGQIVTVSASPLKTQFERFAGGVIAIRDETRLFNLERRLNEQRQFDAIVGKSEAIQKCISLVKTLADVQSSVLLSGESGTGKELMVEALHFLGGRKNAPLVKVNCSALSESLLESELFGHVKGAFTGAVNHKIGRFQKADGGTIFLDEIGDITPKMQLRFLRVIEKMEFERVGDSTPVRVNARIVAATNQDLKRKVSKGEFREDLYYRLKVVEIQLPPLRARRDDIPLLVSHFLKKFNKKLGKKIKGISLDVENIFMNYLWPGNVRELENTLEHAFIICDRRIITVDDLPPEISSLQPVMPLSTPDGTGEPSLILRALEQTSGNKTKAARLLRISRRTLYRKIQHYRLTEQEPSRSVGV